MPRSRTTRPLEDEPWREFAVCVGHEPLFFNEDTEPMAKAICAQCPVAMPCLEAGMRETDGVWGGMSAIDRRALRRYMRLGRSMSDAVRRLQARAS